MTRPFADSSRSVHSVSIGNSSPPLLSSVGGTSSEHRNTSLYHPTGVTLTEHPTVVMTTQQHHPTGVMMTQQHHPTGVMMTQQQHHPTGVMTTQQHYPTGVMTTQQHHSAEVMTGHQHHHTGVMITQANGVSHINSTKHNHESIHADHSPDISSGNNTCNAHAYVLSSMLVYNIMHTTDIMTATFVQMVTVIFYTHGSDTHVNIILHRENTV